MAAAVKGQNNARYFAFKLKKYCLLNCKQTMKRKSTVPFIVSAIGVKLSCESKLKIEEPEAAKLSREYLIKSASVVTAENAIILLTHTALALQQAEKEYKEALGALAFLIEFKLSVLGNAQEEARIWDLILQGRDLVSTTKKKRDNLDVLYKSTWNMVNVSAEVLYMTGAEIVGVGANERLVQFDKVLNEEKVKTENAEVKLRDTELKSINVEGKYAEEHAAELDEELKVLSKQYTEQNEETSNTEDDVKTEETDKKDEDNSEHGPPDVFDEIIQFDETTMKDSAEEL